VGKYVLAALLIVAAASASVAIWYQYVTAERPPTLDRTTYCPLSGPRAVTVLLLDTSDDLPEIGKREVQKYLLDRAEAVPTYGLLDIRQLDPIALGGRVVFSRCNPGDGSNLSEFRGNPALANKHWREGFLAPLRQALSGGLAPQVSNTSPIMAAIQAIAVDRFTGRGAETMSKQLIVVSDLVEHGPAYSQYTGDLSYERFRRSAAYNEFRTNLNGAAVSFFYVQRLTRKPLPSIEHIAFWQQWVRDNNGRFQEAVKLQGVR
jgi:hypothetical protein